ncbi:biopolymer transporter ExbD [Simiduia curdlanivorans]|uniref:ExbD/TolR family protein n=1 Tax=Simiduia curdlanivorans TaxID=1492769 RepID=A0ABV8VA77_9GAMM|nr:biopolymer transporter ExbD [Simiduia curdlanivorans]MDN3639620.1 biopolymer transporter ExbD [Simiduia curdlanivorans]
MSNAVQFKRAKREEESVNLTPLIDVVFLLLIFFMVSTTFTKETHLSIDLPEAKGEAAETQPQHIEILIHADGSYAINGQTLVDKKLPTLLRALQAVGNDNTKTPLIITADANTPHQSVITAMDAAGQLGFVHLSLTTRRPEAQSE